MIAIITDISKAKMIIELTLAPTHIIIIGPNATLGRLFSIVKYGSIISANGLYHHNIDAIKRPINVPNEKLMNVSYIVIHICLNKLLDLYKL